VNIHLTKRTEEMNTRISEAVILKDADKSESFCTLHCVISNSNVCVWYNREITGNGVVKRARSRVYLELAGNYFRD
jgi:hypothetical protein